VASVLATKGLRRRQDKLPVDSTVVHTITCENDNGADLYVKVVVTCSGPYLSTPDGERWESKEKHLADRRSHGKRECSFTSKLLAQDDESGEIRPAEETVVIEFFWRRSAWKEARFLGQLEHIVTVT
jgi:hypothetical protein